jgi:hypothetical protein
VQSVLQQPREYDSLQAAGLRTRLLAADKGLLTRADLGMHYVRLAQEKCQTEQTLRELNLDLEAQCAEKSARYSEVVAKLADANEELRVTAEAAVEVAKDKEAAVKLHRTVEELKQQARLEAVADFEVG